jgi:uncharacterized protein YggE
MKNLLTLLFIFGISTSTFSQTAGNYVYEKMKNMSSNFGGPGGKNIRSLNSKTLTIEASALMNIVPDAQIVVFTIVQLGGSAQEATELIDSKLNPIRAGLNQIGISNSNIVVDMISFIPRYEDTVVKKKFSKTFTEIPKGFELKKNIHIKFKDHELIDKIIAICASFEVYDMAKVEYVILENEENMLSMRDKMLKHLGDKIAFYHDLEIQDEIEIIQVNETTNEYYPQDRYQSYTGHSSSSYEALENKKKKKRSVNRVSKNTSIFYDPLSTKSFDIVMNPGIIEPTVQYTYTLNVIYTLPTAKKDVVIKEKIIEKIITQKEYILISPTGETKVLQM